MAAWRGKVVVELVADDDTRIQVTEATAPDPAESAATEVRVSVEAESGKDAVRAAYRQAAIVISGWDTDGGLCPISETPLGELHYKGYPGRASAKLTLTDERGRERPFDLPLTVRSVGGQVTFVPDFAALDHALAEAMATGKFGRLRDERSLVDDADVAVLEPEALDEAGNCLECGQSFPHRGTCSRSVMRSGRAWLPPRLVKEAATRANRVDDEPDL